MSKKISVADVLRRYLDEDLPEFSEIELTEINQVGNFGNRPIHVACVRGDISEINALLDGGADVNVVGEFGNTPLHEAVGQGHCDVVRLLLDAGALFTLKNDFDETALDLALMKGLDDIASLLAGR
ncbi:ankyrin repeat domain-containing protein [Chitinimonas sp. JJ19]|uniref:ankyrin repeat domain-containing protein n=1 Tax=Chitinimonas sp. JJ19 TaxID=3109352 RepID=UPI003003781C